MMNIYNTIFFVLLQFEYFNGFACQVKYNQVLVHRVIIRIKPLVHQCLSHILAPRTHVLTCLTPRLRLGVKTRQNARSRGPKYDSNLMSQGLILQL